MLEEIVKCKKCSLYKNQPPLMMDCKTCSVMWVGLSAKKIDQISFFDTPLASNTNTGKIIDDIEKMNPLLSFYKTNLVKCAPLNDDGKLRYPNQKEKDICISNLKKEIKTFNPKIVFLLGNEVKNSVEKLYNVHFIDTKEFNLDSIKLNGVQYVPIQHPSYIYIYKRKRIDEYLNSVNEKIREILY